MFRAIFLTLAVAFAVLAAGLFFGWEFWIFDDRGWRAEASGWLALSAAFFALSFHRVTEELDR